MVTAFDIDKFVKRVTPTFLRKPIMLGFAKVLIVNIEDLWSLLAAYYTAVTTDLLVTIQTNILQAHLRVLYPDVGSFKVFIKTQWDNIPQEYIQFIGEHHKQEFCKKLSETTPTEYEWKLSDRVLPYDYYVIVPTTYSTALPAITSILNRKRPAGKRYLIQFQNITS